MSDLSLFQDEPPRSVRCGWKALVSLAFVVGLGFAVLLSSSGSAMVQEPTINMAVQSMQPAKVLPFMQAAKASPFMQPPRASALPGPLHRQNIATGFRTNAFPTSSAFVSQNRVTDLRHALSSSPIQKCVYANRHATLCGNLVVLRPSTAVRATGSSTSTKIDTDKLIKDVSEKWDAVEDKTSAILYASGAIVALVLANSILSTIDAIPLLPGLLETIGLGYSTWFAYRYLLTKSSREELISDLDELKKRISG